MSWSRSPLSKTPKQVFFNPINILTLLHTLLLFYNYTFFRLTFKIYFYRLFQDKPKEDWHHVSKDGMVDPCLHSTFHDDPIWKKELEPLLTIDQVCLTTVATARPLAKKIKTKKESNEKNEKNKKNGNDDTQKNLKKQKEQEPEEDNYESDDDSNTRRIIPVSVMNHIRNQAVPLLRRVRREDRNERAVSYNKIKRLGPLFFLQFKSYVIWRRKKRYCVAKGLKSIQKYYLHRFKLKCRYAKRKRISKGLPIPALQLSAAATNNNANNENNENDEEKNSTKNDKDSNGRDSGDGSLGVVHTLDARNRRRQRKIEEAKLEFEADIQRRRTGLRYNEQLQKEMKEMGKVINTLSTDTSLHHDISTEGKKAKNRKPKKRKRKKKRKEERVACTWKA